MPFAGAKAYGSPSATTVVLCDLILPILFGTSRSTALVALGALPLSSWWGMPCGPFVLGWGGRGGHALLLVQAVSWSLPGCCCGAVFLSLSPLHTLACLSQASDGFETTIEYKLSEPMTHTLLLQERVE